MMQYLYVMLSHTDTKMGRFIRFFTKEEYNHVSLSLDGQLQQFVSFARYRQSAPLAGGYVTESASRLRSCGASMMVRIFRLEISRSDAEKLTSLFELADRSPLIYNSLGALFTGCHLRCPVPGAYTCLEFAGSILGRPFTSIKALEDALAPLEIYHGDLFELLEHTTDQKGSYFQKRSFGQDTRDTVIHFKTLLQRILRLDRPDDPIAACQLDIGKNIGAVSK